MSSEAILDCYTDEPAGLGVPPFIGVWPRYVAGRCEGEPTYLTIDDLRLIRYVQFVREVTIDPKIGRTHIEVLNRTRSAEDSRRILEALDRLVIVAGVQTPGKYLSARPGTLREVHKLLAEFRVPTLLTGPALTGGTQFRGGARPGAAGGGLQRAPAVHVRILRRTSTVGAARASLIRHMPRLANRIVEIETGRGCPRGVGCSFCTEPIKHSVQWRKDEHVVEEVCTLMGLGALRVSPGQAVVHLQL